MTDDRGGTNTYSQEVVATAPANYPFVSDTFDRTQSSGLGSADIGGAWTASPSSGFSVGSGAGVWKLATAGTSRTAYLGATLSDNTDLTLNLAHTVKATGGGTYLTVIGRRVSANTDYRTNIKLTNAAKVQVSLGAMQSSTTETSMTSTVTLPGTIAVGDEIHVRMQVFGTSPTTVRTKVWFGATSEPASWTVSSTASPANSFAGLQAPGAIGLTTYISGSTTVLPAHINVLDVVARPAV